MGLLGGSANWQRFAIPAACGIAMACLRAAPVNAADVANAKSIPLASIDHPGHVDFQREILPLLRDNCLACHNHTRSKADLILETPADILKGGENGAAVVPGHGSDSLLLQAASHQAKPFMPPKDNKVSAVDLTGNQLALIRLWIDQGATGEVRASEPIRWVAPSADVRPIYAVALTADGRYAAAGRANRLDLYDLALQRAVGSLVDQALLQSGLYGASGAAHRGMVESLTFSPDGNRLASGSFGEVKLWHRQGPAVQFTLNGPASSGRPGAAIVAASAGGNWAAVAAMGAPIDLFDAATGKWAKSIDASTSPARAIAFSPDATHLAVASADGGLRISTVAEGELLAQAASPGAVNAIAWVSGGAQLASAGGDGIIRLWTVPQRRGEAFSVSRELKGQHGAINVLAAPSRGDELYSGGEDGSIRRWNLADGHVAGQYAQGGPVATLAVRPDGKVIASAGPNAATRLWDSGRGTAIAELKGSLAATRELAARERAEKLASGDVAYFTGVGDRALAGEKAATDRLKTATDAKTPADAKAAEAQTARDRAAKAKEEADKPPTTMPADAKPDPKLKQRSEEAAKALAQAETQLAAATLLRNNASNEFQLATAAVAKAGEELSAARASLTAAQAGLKSASEAAAAARRGMVDRPPDRLAFSSDNSTLATCGPDGAIQLWAADTGIPVEEPQSPPGGAIALEFAGQKLLVGSAKQCVLMTLGGSWSLERTIGSGDAASVLEDRVTALAFSPDGKLLATGAGEPSRNGQIKLWDAATGNAVREFKDAHSDTVLALEFSPDGKLLASGSADRFAKVFDAASGSIVKTFEGHSDHVNGVSWKADGRCLATCGADNQVKFWDVPSGERKSSAAGFGKEVTAIHYLGLTDQAIAASADGQVRIFNDAGAAVKSLPSPGDFLHIAALTPDGAVLIAGGESGALFVWREPFASPPMTLPSVQTVPAIGR